MIRKKKELIQSRRLRLSGKSYEKIAKQLHVSPASVYNWCKDISLSEVQRLILSNNSIVALQKGRKKAAAVRKKKREYQARMNRQLGIQEVGKLTNREQFIAGVALYWAEGFKKDNRLGFANSDPRMAIFILHWLINICMVSKEAIRLRVGINISHKDRVSEIEKYWSELAQIPLAQFQKPFFQKFTWKKQFLVRDNYYGVLRIRANNQGELFQKIHGWLSGMAQQDLLISDLQV